MKQIRYRLIFTALAAVALMATGCSKEPQAEGDSPATGEMVSVALPLDFADTETTAQGVSAAPTTSRAAANNAADGFTVSFGDEALASVKGGAKAEAATTRGAATIPATRTIAQELTNVWVLQFNSSGKNVSTDNVGNLAAGAHLTAPSLEVGTGYTIYVVANGVASGLTTSNPATLDDFESTMLYTTDVTNAATLPLAGKLTGVSVVNLGDGNGRLKLLDGSSAVTLTRIHAEVTLVVNVNVTGYTLTSAQLYNVPTGATYGWNSSTTTFPASSAANFSFTSTAAAGKAPVATTSGRKTTYEWFTGDNRRGNVAAITTQPDRNSTKAPAYATFARVTLTNSTSSTQKIYYDIYLGSGSVTNFDLLRNHTYTATASIKGSADFQEALIYTDARVSGVGFPLYLTDSNADSPIVISPKNMESAFLTWGPETSIPAAQGIFNGKTNTDAIMATSTTAYLAAKHCRDKGSKYYLPSQAELMQMWIYMPAIPVVDRPASGNFWSSTESSSNTSNAWCVYFLNGTTGYYGRSTNYYVRCVRETGTTTWKYPKVETSNTIVSRDAAGGIKSDALLTPAQKTWLMNQSAQPIYNEQSEYNKVSAKFEVASTDASASSTWENSYTLCKSYSIGAAAGSWRVPTQRELMLIWMFRSKLTGCGDITSTSGYFWSGTEDSGGTSNAWHVTFSNGNPGYYGKSYSCYVRCVRDL